jgi:hypothetical protein
MMAQLSFNRKTEDVTDHSIIRPGVENKAAASLIEGVGAAAINYMGAKVQEKEAAATAEVDTQLQTAETNYLINSPAARREEIRATQESIATYDPTKATPGDTKAFEASKAKLASLEAGFNQGTINADQYRIRSESLVKAAIAERPHLAEEFRALSDQHLGGATVEWMMKREQEDDRREQAEAADAKVGERAAMEAQRKILIDHNIFQALHITNKADMDALTMRPEVQEILKKQGAISLQAKNAEDLAQINEHNKQHPPAAIEAQQIKTVNAGFTTAYNALARGSEAIRQALAGKVPQSVAQGTPQQQAEFLARGLGKQMAEFEATLSQGMTNASKKMVDAVKIRSDAFRAAYTPFLTPEGMAKAAQGYNEYLVAVSQASAYEDTPGLTNLAAVKEIVGEETLAMGLGQNPNMYASYTALMASVMSRSATPEEVVLNGPDILNNLATRLNQAETKGQKLDPNTAAGVGRSMSDFVDNFSVLANSDYSVEAITGTAGVYNTFSRIGPTLSKQLTPEGLAMVADSYSGLVARQNVAMMHIISQNPTTSGLKGKWDFNPNAMSSDTLYVPKNNVVLTNAEAIAMANANRKSGWSVARRTLPHLYPPGTSTAEIFSRTTMPHAPLNPTGKKTQKVNVSTLPDAKADDQWWNQELAGGD